MANYRIETFIPLVDGTGASIDPTSFISSVEGIALGSITISYQAVSIYKSGGLQGQGSFLLWAVADTNVAAAQSAYNSFLASHSWGTVTPHYLAVLLTGVG